MRIKQKVGQYSLNEHLTVPDLEWLILKFEACLLPKFQYPPCDRLITTNVQHIHGKIKMKRSLELH